MQFDFKVENKILTPLNGEQAVIADNSDYSVHFVFDDEWASKTKTVRFVNGKNYVDVILPEDNTVFIPIEIMSPPVISLGVYAGDLHTTSCAKLKCRTSILTAEGTPAEPRENVYSQLVSCYDEVKRSLSDINGEFESIAASEAERCAAEKDRQALYEELSAHADSYSNAYAVSVANEGTAQSITLEHCPIGKEPLEFYVMGRCIETVPSEGKTPETPSTLRFQQISRIIFGSDIYSYTERIPVYVLPDDVKDVLDMKRRKFVHNIGCGQFHIVNGAVRIYDTVTERYADKEYTVSRVDSTSAANVFTDSPDMYPNGKAGMKTFSPFFNSADSIDACEHGYHFDGDKHYFAYGEKATTDEEAAALFYNFVQSLYDSGTPLTVYYEYEAALEEEISGMDITFKASETEVNIRNMMFLIKYNADLCSLVNGLQAQIDELTASLVEMAEGGEA